MAGLDDFSRLTDVEWRRSFEAEYGLFIAEGELVIRRAIDAGCVPRSCVTSAKWLDSLPRELLDIAEVHVLSDEEIESVAGFHVHRGALAAFERPAPMDPETLIASTVRVVVLEDLVDHENVGSVFRSAAGLGFDAVLLDPRCADPLYRRSLKVSMGATLAVPYARGETSELARLLDSAGFEQCALTPAGDIELAAVSGGEKMALWLGAERYGLSREALSAVRHHVAIPMQRGTDSLNVAIAGAIAMWHLRPRGSK